MKIFYDFHIHSCLSPCASDDMTPFNIAGMGYLKGLSAMALTDHNSCANCPSFFKACERYSIIPIAGMELSTAEDVHLVLLFRNLDSAMKFESAFAPHRMDFPNNPEVFGNQFLTDENDEIAGTEEKLLIAASDLWMGDAVELARRHGALVYPAHIDRPSNGIIAVLGDFPQEYGFECVEFNDASNREGYFEKYPAVRGRGVVVSSDAHRLEMINEAENFLVLPDGATPGASAILDLISGSDM